MDQPKTHFVGYETLEALLVTHDHTVPLYMTVIEEGRPTGNPGVVSRCTYIVVSDVQQGVARYWRYRLGCSTEVAGQLLDPAGAVRLRARGERAKAVLRCAMGVDFGLTAQAATVSYPRELAMMEGDTGLLTSERTPELEIGTV